MQQEALAEDVMTQSPKLHPRMQEIARLWWDLPMPERTIHSVCAEDPAAFCDWLPQCFAARREEDGLYRYEFIGTSLEDYFGYPRQGDAVTFGLAMGHEKLVTEAMTLASEEIRPVLLDILFAAPMGQSRGSILCLPFDRTPRHEPTTELVPTMIFGLFTHEGQANGALSRGRITAVTDIHLL